ncbi:hypothetical protein HPB50_016481 [Hyalomma asiaticum]|uniref:Uncharacterized protein n=1 Tax=Hyalomma asiaticum TaxID=266040 RepID=A0ACB7RY09_HYAAI|nr:hypothetical protein HPB50_016481 [Hyalomma asiaticum]
MSDGSNWDENFGGARAGTESGWRSNSSGMNGGNGAFGAPWPPWRAPRFAWRGPPIRRNARGPRRPFFAGRRSPLLPTPPCAFRIRCPPSFNVQRMGWQSSQPVRFASTYYVGDYSAGQSRHSRGRRTDGYDNDLTQCDESPSGREEATREQGPRDWHDPKRRASRTGYYDTDRPCEDHDSSGAYNELPDCRRPVQRKCSSSPSTSEGKCSATPVINRHSPLTSRSSDRTGDASSVQSTPQGTRARCIPPGPQHSCTTPTPVPVSETSSDDKLAKRTHDCSISYDAKGDSSGKRPRPDFRAGKFRSGSEERSSSASSGVPPQGIERSDAPVAAALDSMKGKERTSVRPSGPSVVKAATRPKPPLRKPVEFASLVRPGIAKYGIPRVSGEEQRSPAQTKKLSDVPLVQQESSSSGSASKEPRPTLRCTSDLGADPVGLPQTADVVAERSRGLARIENLEPATLHNEEHVELSSSLEQACVHPIAVVDSTTNLDSRKEDRCEVASGVSKCEKAVKAVGLSPKSPSLEAYQVTVTERPLSPLVVAFEEVCAEEACGDAPEGTESLGVSLSDNDALVSGARLVRDLGSDKEPKRSSAETTYRCRFDKWSSVDGLRERPFLCFCDSHIKCDATAEVCENDTSSDATEIYQYDQTSHSSEVGRRSSGSSSSETEIYDVLVSEISSEEDAALEGVKAIVGEPSALSNDWAGITRRLPAASSPPTTAVGAVASSSQPAHLFATTNREADSGHSSVLLEAARLNAEAPGQASLVRASVQPGITVDTRTSAGAAPGTFGSPGTGTSGIPGANVPARTAGLPSPSDSWGTGHRPALVQSTVIMPGAPPLQIPMYELKLASTSAAGTPHRFPVVDGPDGRRGALFELMTVSCLYVLNMIEDHVTRERVIQLYYEGRHSDTMEAYGAQIRELTQAAVERQRDTWKGLIGLLRKLASIEWLLPQPGSCAGARVRELYELDPSF